MPRRKEPRIPDAVLDQLLAGADPKTVFDPNGLLDELKKALAERILNAEMDHHLAGEEPGNRRNGYGKKTVITDTSQIELAVPRDRQARFDPQLIAKYQRRFHILYLSIERRINHLAAIMKPSLIRMVGRLGLEFTPIGEPVEYHGRRQPCIAFIPELIKRSQSQATPWWRFVSNRNPWFAQSMVSNAIFRSMSDSQVFATSRVY
jgi:hypothetical protein